MGLKIDGIAASEHLDSSGEILDISGHDIADLVEGRGVLNWEHSNKSPEDIIGKITYAKKIMKASEAETDRQKMFWNSVKKPFVYIIAELFDDEEHPGSVAAAAMIRYYARRKEKLLSGFSIEGSTLEREGNYLKESVGRRVALTLRPCNKTAIADLLEDPKLSDYANKTISKTESSLVKVDTIIIEDDKPSVLSAAEELRKAVTDLNKTLTAGMGNVAPGQLVGGAALVPEHITGKVKNKIKAALRDWNRVRPLKETIKAALPEVSESYIDHFTDLAEELALKKNMPKLIRVSAGHAHPSSNEEQKQLIEGLYHDPTRIYSPGHKGFTPNNYLYKLKNDQGQDVFVKHFNGETNDEVFGPSDSRHIAASAYSRIARDVMGMEDHVPLTALYSHPKIHDGQIGQATEFSEGKTPLEDPKILDHAIEKSKHNEVPQKLAIMDHILGQSDRHEGNIIVGSDGHIKHIDNDYAFTWGGMEPNHKISDLTIGPKTSEWLKGIDAKKIAQIMADHHMSSDVIYKAISALKAYQKVSKKPMKLRDAWGIAQSAIHSGAKKGDEQ